MPTRRKISETVALKHAGTGLLSASWPFACLLLCLFVFFFYSSAAAADYLVYLPKPVEAIDAPLSGEGVLVKKIMIQRGDTLSAISRRFSGKGSYFPQILLFNNIRNPNRIYAGRKLLVPVSGHRSSKKQPPPPSVLPAKTNARILPFAIGKESRRITAATARCPLLSDNSLTRRPHFLPKASIARPLTGLADSCMCTHTPPSFPMPACIGRTATSVFLEWISPRDKPSFFLEQRS